MSSKCRLTAKKINETIRRQNTYQKSSSTDDLQNSFRSRDYRFNINYTNKCRNVREASGEHMIQQWQIPLPCNMTYSINMRKFK